MVITSKSSMSSGITSWVSNCVGAGAAGRAPTPDVALDASEDAAPKVAVALLPSLAIASAEGRPTPHRRGTGTADNLSNPGWVLEVSRLTKEAQWPPAAAGGRPTRRADFSVRTRPQPMVPSVPVSLPRWLRRARKACERARAAARRGKESSNPKHPKHAKQSKGLTNSFKRTQQTEVSPEPVL